MQSPIFQAALLIVLPSPCVVITGQAMGSLGGFAARRGWPGSPRHIRGRLAIPPAADASLCLHLPSPFQLALPWHLPWGGWGWPEAPYSRTVAAGAAQCSLCHPYSPLHPPPRQCHPEALQGRREIETLGGNSQGLHLFSFSFLFPVPLGVGLACVFEP